MLNRLIMHTKISLPRTKKIQGCTPFLQLCNSVHLNKQCCLAMTYYCDISMTIPTFLDLVALRAEARLDGFLDRKFILTLELPSLCLP